MLHFVRCTGQWKFGETFLILWYPQNLKEKYGDLTWYIFDKIFIPTPFRAEQVTL